jgi:hypothetical protein
VEPALPSQKRENPNHNLKKGHHESVVSVLLIQLFVQLTEFVMLAGL